MVKQVGPGNAMPFMNFNSNLGYWEFDLYVGWAGLLFLALGLFLWMRRQTTLRRFSPLLFPMLVFALLSVRDVYLPFTHLPIPLLNGERVTARMLIVPFTLSMILASGAIQTWLDKKQVSSMVQLAGLLGLGYLVFDLVKRTLAWQVSEAFKVFTTTPVNLAIKVVSNHADPPYTNLLAMGALVSLLSLLIAIWLVWRESR
jgi:hypothetical protein